MVRVEINNFQSIAREVVDIDGFSALTGRSNIGKSAIVRAIKAALTGAPSDSYVRHSPTCLRLIKGTKSCNCFCSVHIKTEGLDLLWEKGDSVNRYRFNNQDYSVVGRGTPDFLAKDFAPVKVGDDKEVLQVSDQFKPIFILNKPGTVVADVLSDVAKLNQINVAMRMVEKDRKDAVATRKVREKDVTDLQLDLIRYDGLDKAVERVSEAENLNAQVESVCAQVATLEEFIGSLLGIGHKIKSLKEVHSVAIPDIAPLVGGGTEFIILEEFVLGFERKTTAVLSLGGIDHINPPDIEPFSLLGTAYSGLVQWASKVDVLRVFFDRFQKFGLLSFPSLDSLEHANEHYSQLDLWNSRSYELARTLAQLKEAHAKASEEEGVLLEEFRSLGVCSKCNKSLAPCSICQN